MEQRNLSCLVKTRFVSGGGAAEHASCRIVGVDVHVVEGEVAGVDGAFARRHVNYIKTPRLRSSATFSLISAHFSF